VCAKQVSVSNGPNFWAQKFRRPFPELPEASQKLPESSARKLPRGLWKLLGSSPELQEASQKLLGSSPEFPEASQKLGSQELNASAGACRAGSLVDAQGLAVACPPRTLVCAPG